MPALVVANKSQWVHGSGAEVQGSCKGKEDGEQECWKDDVLIVRLL